jgi:hypothetical protein
LETNHVAKISEKKPNAFELFTPSRTFYMVAGSVEERDAWIEALNEAVIFAKVNSDK